MCQAHERRDGFKVSSATFREPRKLVGHSVRHVGFGFRIGDLGLRVFRVW